MQANCNHYFLLFQLGTASYVQIISSFTSLSVTGWYLLVSHKCCNIIFLIFPSQMVCPCNFCTALIIKEILCFLHLSHNMQDILFPLHTSENGRCLIPQDLVHTSHINVHGDKCTPSIVSFYSNQKCKLLKIFSKRTHIQNVTKICAVGIMLFQARQVDGHVSREQQSLFVL